MEFRRVLFRSRAPGRGGRSARCSRPGCRSVRSPGCCSWQSNRRARPGAPASRAGRRAFRSTPRSEEHTSELLSLIRISYSLFFFFLKFFFFSFFFSFSFPLLFFFFSSLFFFF